MKKLFKKKGFTLVECLVAIAIFAIMAMMVATLYGGTINQYKQNKDIDRDLTSQLDTVAQDEELRIDDTLTTTDGNLTFNFPSLTKNIPYAVQGSSTEGQDIELNYLKGKVSAAGEATPSNPVDPADPSTPATPGDNNVNLITTRIYGSRGIESITINSITKATDQRIINGSAYNVYYIALTPYDINGDTGGGSYSYREFKMKFNSELASIKQVKQNGTDYEEVSDTSKRYCVDHINANTIRITVDYNNMGHAGNMLTYMKNQLILEIATKETINAAYFGLTNTGATDDAAPTNNVGTSDYDNGWIFKESNVYAGVYGYLKS